jgi:LAS superfamily LD-carboxypeptidase LdcB
MPPKIYPPYGELNKIDLPDIQDRIDLQNVSVSNILRVVTQKAYTPDALANTGPYKAVVLRVDQNPSQPEPGSFLNYLPFFGSKNAPSLARIKARIPELHGMLPIPETIGEDSTQHYIIEMYPTFTAQNKDTPLPEVGSLIWVDFVNKTNFTDGIYIKPIVEGQPAGAPNGKVSPADSFSVICDKALDASPPDGDALPGVNKPLSHAGLPLLPRQAKTLAHKRREILKGHRSSATFTKLWDEVTKSTNFNSVSWIGTLNSNGLVDHSHPEGKRSTLICCPSTTNLAYPVELIYFFHGIGGFNNRKELLREITPQLKKLAEAKRNFVFVMPELPWARNIRDWRKSRAGLWAWETQRNAPGNSGGTRDNFTNFHREVQGILESSFQKNTQISFTTLLCHGHGGSALYNAVKYGALEVVRPNKIVMADASYSDWTEYTWNRYVSRNRDTEFDIISGIASSKNNAQDFYTKYQSRLNENTSVQHFNQNHTQMVKIMFTYTNPKIIEKRESEAVRVAEKLQANRPDPETQELPYVVSEEKSKYPEQPGIIPPIGMGNAKVSPSIKSKVSSNSEGQRVATSATLEKARPFEEARVYIKDYGTIPSNSNLLVSVPAPNGTKRKLHKLAAKRFEAMNEAWLRENPGQPPLLVASGHRTRKWEDRASYEAAMWKKFPNGGPTEARKWIAYASPHETGLALDIGSNGLSPTRENNEQQKQTRCYKWLVENAHLYGFTPYKTEAWHWECRLPKESWASGEEFTDDFATTVVDPGSSNIPIDNLSPARDSGPCVTSLGDLTGQRAGNLEEDTFTQLSGEPNTRGTLTPEQKRTLIVQLSERYNLEPEIAYAFLTVETGNKPGFCANTGRPLIRFEPHIFANPKRLRKWNIPESSVPWAGSSSKERKAKWAALGFSHGSNCATNQKEYEALSYAINIHEEHAYQSISTGAAQIMGFNHRLVGYKTAKEMFEDYSVSEANQIIGFFRYIERRAGGRMLTALRKKDMVTAALLYNGRGKEQLYGDKLAKYYTLYKDKGLPA